MPRPCSVNPVSGRHIRLKDIAPEDRQAFLELQRQCKPYDQAHRLVKKALAILADYRGALQGDDIFSTVEGWVELAKKEAIENGTFIIKKPARRNPIPHGTRKEVLERDYYRCQSCGTHLDLQIDHVLPVSKGGPSTAENLQTLCQSCNCRKRDKVFPEQAVSR